MEWPLPEEDVTSGIDMQSVQNCKSREFKRFAAALVFLNQCHVKMIAKQQPGMHQAMLHPMIRKGNDTRGEGRRTGGGRAADGSHYGKRSLSHPYFSLFS